MTSIVRATTEQAQVLTEIAISAKRYWNYPEAWIQQWIPLMTITSEYISAHEVWMMIDEDSPIAFYSLAENQDGAWLDNLWVLPSQMGRGIGKTLFEHAIVRCKVKKISVLKIEADPNAQPFYEKMGARKISERETQVDGQRRILPIMEINL